MARVCLIALFASSLALAGCTKSDPIVRATPLKMEPKKPHEPRLPARPDQPDPPEQPVAPSDDAPPAIPVAGTVVPTRDEGQKAFTLGKALMRDGDFKGAEVELKTASAAGIEGSDKMLLRVRTEAAGEDLFTSARKKIEASDFGGARKDLAQVPPGTVVATKARALLAEIDQREVTAYKEMKEKASERLGLLPDAGEEKKAEPKKP